MNRMEMVRENYSNLLNSISNLGNKVNKILQKQEDDFLGAYQTQMRNVQKDFETLQGEIDEKEKAIEENVLVKKIEQERDWYKREALHLDQVLVKLKQREKMLSEKNEELNQDRTWLSNQLKLVMKQKNQLESRIKNDKQAIENNQDDQDISCHSDIDQSKPLVMSP